MHWDNYDKVHLAARSLTDQVTSDGVPYISRGRIIRFDVSDHENETLDYHYEFSGWFGNFGTIEYIDTGTQSANLFVGGSVDASHISSSDPKQLSLLIMRLDSDYQIYKAWNLQTFNGWYTDTATHPYIDLMQYDPSSNKMYGTTRSTVQLEPSRQTYIFRIGLLGATKDLDPSDVTVKQVDSSTSDLGLEVYITGIRVKDDRIHLVYYQNSGYHSHSFWYAILDFVNT